MAERRHVSRLAVQPDQGLLVVGGRTALLDALPPAEVVVATYVDLVFAQRAVRPSCREDLRERELVELAELLALPPAELDAMIDAEVDRLLGRGVVPPSSRLPRTLAFGALGVVAVAAAIAATGAI